jgi:hypothetical protein
MLPLYEEKIPQNAVGCKRKYMEKPESPLPSK